MIRKLKIYDGPEHPHTAQLAKPFEMSSRRMPGAAEA
jgi:ribosomal protein L13